MVKVAILGIGTVGGGTAEVLTKNRELIARRDVYKRQADGSALVQGLEKALLAALAVFAAGGAVVIAIFAHYFYLFCKQ